MSSSSYSLVLGTAKGSFLCGDLTNLYQNTKSGKLEIHTVITGTSKTSEGFKLLGSVMANDVIKSGEQVYVDLGNGKVSTS